eukprot:gene16157-22318_t
MRACIVGSASALLLLLAAAMVQSELSPMRIKEYEDASVRLMNMENDHKSDTLNPRNPEPSQSELLPMRIKEYEDASVRLMGMSELSPMRIKEYEDASVRLMDMVNDHKASMARGAAGIRAMNVSDAHRRKLTAALTGPGGFVFVATDDADNRNHCGGNRCGNLYVNVLQQAIYYSDLRSQATAGQSLPGITVDLPGVASIVGSGILAIGINGDPAEDSFKSWIAAGAIKEKVTYLTSTSDIRNVIFSQFKVIYIPSTFRNFAGSTVRGIKDDQNNELSKRKADMQYFVNNLGGSLVALGQSALKQPYGFLPKPLSFKNFNFEFVETTPDLDAISNTSTGPNLSHRMWPLTSPALTLGHLPSAGLQAGN